jgi:hypothetical protein
MKSLFKCNCCGCSDLYLLYKFNDELIEKCRECGVIFTNYRRVNFRLADYYGKDYYEKWTEEAKNRKIMWKNRFEQLKKFCGRGLITRCWLRAG